MVALIVLFSLFSQAIEDRGSVSVFTFRDGQPLRETVIQVGDKDYSAGLGGLVRIENLKSGKNLFKLNHKGQAMGTFVLNVVAGRNVEVIINLANEQMDVDIEGGSAAKVSAETPKDGPRFEIKGVISSVEGGQPVAGANVFVRGQSVNVTTNEDGEYKIQLPRGKHVVSVLHRDFSAQSLEVDVQKKGRQNIQLTPAAIDLGEFVVLAPHTRGSIASLLEERKKSASVKDVIGAEQMSKSGDGSAASALRRVTGLSLVGGKFVYVRGLGERYSSTILNGAQIPSPDPDRRVVPLDMFPSSVIESMSIQKSYTPQSPGEFGGGTIEIRTKTVPEKKYAKLSISTKTRPGTTGRQAPYYSSGLSSFGEIGDARKMPSILQSATANNRKLKEDDGYSGGFALPDLIRISRSVNRNYDLRKIALPRGEGASVGGGWLGKIGALPGTLGLNIGADYGSDWKVRDEVRRKYIIDNGMKLDDVVRYLKTDREINTSGILSATYKEKGSQIQLMSMVSDITEDTVRVREKITGERTEDNLRRVLKRQLLVNQLSWKGQLAKKSEWRFQLTSSTATNKEPDRKEDLYDCDDGECGISADEAHNLISWADLLDESRDLQLGFDLNIFDRKSLQASLLFGAGYTVRERNYQKRRFHFRARGSVNDMGKLSSANSVFSDENIHSEGFVLEENTLATDNYTAEQKIESSYLASQGVLYKKVQYLVGARSERSSQNVATFHIHQRDSREATELETFDVLPVTNLTWLINDKMQVRLGYSQTISRPDFKELSAASFKDERYSRRVKGNPKLKATLIDNIDLRWEWYRRSNESLSVGVFEKTFENPVEISFEPGSKGEVTFDNAPSAVNRGIEIEARKSLTSRWEISGNISRIDSQIKISPENKGALTSLERPLQGQSPYIYNFQLSYDREKSGTTFSFLYNVFGPRIYLVGSDEKPDIYEAEFQQLDAVVSQKIFSSAKVKMKVKNILNPEVRHIQGDKVTRNYYKGHSVSVSLSATY